MRRRGPLAAAQDARALSAPRALGALGALALGALVSCTPAPPLATSPHAQDSASAPSASSPPHALSPAGELVPQVQLAPFTLALPEADFERLDPASINPDASIVARSRDELVIVMVIAAPAPALAGVAPPSTRELRQAALSRMRHNLPELRLLERGERQIGGQPALTARASAQVKGLPHLYELAYMQHQGWRYQLITFAQASEHEALATRTDQVVGAWRFAASDSASEDSPAPQATTPEDLSAPTAAPTP